ncbi:MAG: hypothetical protein IPJ03_00075 [Ignavibacteriales bacterium]|nr:hypothetical protein [Ignavibacteriales bacterium]
MNAITEKNTAINYKGDIINLYALFILSVGAIYIAPRGIGVLLQIISFYRSEKDYFWLALVFIIENFPGAFFSRYTSDIQHTFSLLPDSPVGTLYFWMVFILVALFKALQKRVIINLF